MDGNRVKEKFTIDARYIGKGDILYTWSPDSKHVRAITIFYFATNVFITNDDI